MATYPPPQQTLILGEPEDEAKQVRKLARRLRRANPVRQIVFALLEKKTEEIVSVQPLLDALAKSSDTRWRERTVAAWALGQVSLNDSQKEEAASLLCLIAADRQGSRGKRFLKRSVRAVLRTALFSLLPFLNTVLIGSLLHGSFVSSEDSLHNFLYEFWVLFTVALVILTLFFPLISFLIDSHRNDRVRHFAVRSLGRLGRPSSVRTLTNLSQLIGTPLSREAHQALGRILPSVTHKHYPQYSELTLDLCRLLKHPDDRDAFCFLLLNVLEKIGDRRAVQTVERLTKRGAPQKIREAAARILPVLLERQRKETEAQRLLRSSDAPNTSETLLRPAGSNDAEPHLLVRPSPPEETAEQIKNTVES